MNSAFARASRTGHLKPFNNRSSLELTGIKGVGTGQGADDPVDQGRKNPVR